LLQRLEKPRLPTTKINQLQSGKAVALHPYSKSGAFTVEKTSAISRPFYEIQFALTAEGWWQIAQLISERTREFR